MGTYYVTTVAFTGRRPNPGELDRLNRALRAVDGQAPAITSSGIEALPWRSPALDLEQLLGLLHRAGFPCEGSMVRQDRYENYGVREVPAASGGPVEISNYSLKSWDDALTEEPDGWRSVTINSANADERIDAHVQADWLADAGFPEAAAQLRLAFPLPTAEG